MASNRSPVPLGAKAAPFSLIEPLSGRVVSLDDFAETSALLVMFWANHCPYVKYIADSVAAFAREYEHASLGIVAISANDVERYPADHPDKMKLEAQTRGFIFPYLYDESQAVPAAYDARCTPDFYLFDHERTLVYHGRYDDARPGTATPITGRDVRAAVDAVLSGGTPSSEQYNSIGCTIKWKSGNRPVN